MNILCVDWTDWNELLWNRKPRVSHLRVCWISFLKQTPGVTSCCCLLRCSLRTASLASGSVWSRRLWRELRRPWETAGLPSEPGDIWSLKPLLIFKQVVRTRAEKKPQEKKELRIYTTVLCMIVFTMSVVWQVYCRAGCGVVIIISTHSNACNVHNGWVNIVLTLVLTSCVSSWLIVV